MANYNVRIRAMYVRIGNIRNRLEAKNGWAKKRDIKTFIGLVSEEIDRVGEARKKHGFYDPGHFYHLTDIRNKLLVMPLDEEPPLSISGEVGREILRARG